MPPLPPRQLADSAPRPIWRVSGNLGNYLDRLGERYELPRLAELLARPDFEPLQRTLSEWNVELDALQAAIDEVMERMRRGVE